MPCSRPAASGELCPGSTCGGHDLAGTSYRSKQWIICEHEPTGPSAKLLSTPGGKGALGGVTSHTLESLYRMIQRGLLSFGAANPRMEGSEDILVCSVLPQQEQELALVTVFQ